MKTIRAKVTVDLEIDVEVYNVPLDHDVSYELSDILHNTFYEVEGIEITDVKTIQKRQTK
jgi:hypothetical protein